MGRKKELSKIHQFNNVKADHVYTIIRRFEFFNDQSTRRDDDDRTLIYPNKVSFIFSKVLSYLHLTLINYFNNMLVCSFILISRESRTTL